MTKWIKCSDRFPVNEQECLTYSANGYYGISIYFDSIQYPKKVKFPSWYDAYTPHIEHSGITHWAELPEPPND